MSEDLSTNGPTAPAEDDDVEAHGLREVVVGVSAAAVVAGGAAGLAMATQHGGAHAKAGAGHTSVSAHNDAVRAADVTAGDRAAGTAPQASGATVAAAGLPTAAGHVAQAAQGAHGVADPAGVQVRQGDLPAQPGSLDVDVRTGDLVGSTDRSLDSAVSFARTTRDGALGTADGAVRHAGVTVDAAGHTVAITEQSTLHTVGATEQAALATTHAAASAAGHLASTEVQTVKETAAKALGHTVGASTDGSSATVTADGTSVTVHTP